MKRGRSTGNPTLAEAAWLRMVKEAAFKKAQLAAARANGKKLVQPTVSKAEKAKRQRKAGSAKGAATMQRRRAA